MNDYDNTDPTVHGGVTGDVKHRRGGFSGVDADKFKLKIPQLYNSTINLAVNADYES